MGHSNWEDAPLVTVNPLKLRREAATMGRFAAVGLLGAVIDFSVLNLLIFAAGWSSPLQMAGANLVSTSAAILSNFFLNRSWTFRSGAGGRQWAQFLQFIAVSAVGLLINSVVFYLANHYVFGPLLHTGLSVQLAKAAAIGVGMVWNFIVNRLWTFRHQQGNAVMDASGSSAAGALPASAAQTEGNRRSLVLRWLLPLAIGLLLLGGINLGLYTRLAGPPAAAAPVAETAEQAAAPAPTAAPTAASAAALAEAAGAAEQPAPAAALLAAGDPRFNAVFSDGAAPSGWLTVDGDWQVKDGALVQTQVEGFDRATLYVDPFANYVLRVRFKLLEGTGAGVLFNAPGTDSKNGSHMVRFTDDGSGLFWGHFASDGAFTGQGYAATGAPGTDWRVLEIYSGDGTYDIHLDGALVAQDIPLLSPNGHIGLTTAQSSAAFAEVDVFDLLRGQTASAAAPTPAPTPAQELNGAGLEFSTINGDWVQDGGSIRQDNNTATDFSLGTGVSAENYTLELVITLPADETLADAGGGILFHMPTRDKKEGAQMVRFVQGGQGLTWGVFDAAGGFTGQGYVDLNLPAGEPQQLALTVRGGVFDVLINGEAVVEEVPTAAQSGWIGLISYRGPVTFEGVKLTLGSVVP